MKCADLDEKPSDYVFPAKRRKLKPHRWLWTGCVCLLVYVLFFHGKLPIF